jgi:hypothetical protein
VVGIEFASLAERLWDNSVRVFPAFARTPQEVA